LLEMYLGILPA